jgi:hypothetical protein
MSPQPASRCPVASLLAPVTKLFNKVELCTPRNQVPGLITSPAPAVAVNSTTNQASIINPVQIPTPRTRRTKTGRAQKNTNIIVAAAQYRFEKARGIFQTQCSRRLQALRPN